jgi:hypothetical protein
MMVTTEYDVLIVAVFAVGTFTDNSWITRFGLCGREFSKRFQGCAIWNCFNFVNLQLNISLSSRDETTTRNNEQPAVNRIPFLAGSSGQHSGFYNHFFEYCSLNIQ